MTMHCPLRTCAKPKPTRGRPNPHPHSAQAGPCAPDTYPADCSKRAFELPIPIDVLNEKFGTDFDQADKLFFDQIEEELFGDETLKKQAQNNDIDNFKYGFEEMFVHKLIDRMDDNQKIFDKVMDSSDFKKTVQEWMLKKLFDRFNKDKK
jgi:hypothetical protein